MKHFFYIFTLFALLTPFISNSMCPIIGQLNEEFIDGDMTSWSTLSFLMDIQNYTSGSGGIVFPYPDEIFTAAPLTLISVNTLVSHDTTQTYTAEIVANDENSATVVAYFNDGMGTISEAATDSVAISIYAVGN